MGILKSKETTSDLIAALSQANQSVGKLESENQRLAKDLEKVENEKQSLEFELSSLKGQIVERDNVVNSVFGLNLELMSQGGSNAAFTERSLILLKTAVEPEVKKVASEMTFIDFISDQRFDEFCNDIPGYDKNVNADSQKQSVAEHMGLLISMLRGFRAN